MLKIPPDHRHMKNPYFVIVLFLYSFLIIWYKNPILIKDMCSINTLKHFYISGKNLISHLIPQYDG